MDMFLIFYEGFYFYRSSAIIPTSTLILHIHIHTLTIALSRFLHSPSFSHTRR